MGVALYGIRQTANGRRESRFTGQLHHIYAVERLKQAHLAVERDVAAGVDGQTWQSCGQGLEGNLLDLSDRLARGGYRPRPVKSVYIDKAHGSKRPLGVPALEELIMFIERREADARVVRLIKNWLHAGVLEDGRLTQGELGTVQGDDAERFQRALEQRLGQFGLKLYPDKTRLIEFGRFAWDNRRRRGQGKPETFNFLGFTHCRGKTRKGRFMALRITSGEGMRAKLVAVKTELRERMHQPIAEQGKYLRSVVAGHGRCFAVACNGARVQTFRFQAGRLWRRTPCRRSQAEHLNWKRMHKIVAHGLPSTRMGHPDPNQRPIVTTQGRSRMR